jgi:hypothetical protein
MTVEVCSSIKSVEYLYKYKYKGNDAANLIISESVQNQKLDWDEIKKYAEGRYVGSPEGCLRLFQSKMHGKSHTVVRLPVHMPDAETVIFEAENAVRAFQDAQNKKSMLTAWFQLNNVEPTGTIFRNTLLVYFPTKDKMMDFT